MDNIKDKPVIVTIVDRVKNIEKKQDDRYEVTFIYLSTRYYLSSKRKKSLRLLQESKAKEIPVKVKSKGKTREIIEVEVAS
ncbi:MAG: hypothetical protein K8T10_05890 [Candidatus Eremiobacteraeota bacterium]|nr:hypothetical protein [Candidatus Eremiobacteraeota bacterium]